jgi:hypothetical protein
MIVNVERRRWKMGMGGGTGTGSAPGFWRQLGIVLKAIFITGPLLILLLIKFGFRYFILGQGREKTKPKGGKSCTRSK